MPIILTDQDSKAALHRHLPVLQMASAKSTGKNLDLCGVIKVLGLTGGGNALESTSS